MTGQLGRVWSSVPLGRGPAHLQCVRTVTVWRQNSCGQGQETARTTRTSRPHQSQRLHPPVGHPTDPFACSPHRSSMIITKADRMVIYQNLFKEGVMVAKKDLCVLPLPYPRGAAYEARANVRTGL